MKTMKFKDIVLEDGLLKGPFGSDLKKSLYVPKGVDTVKVWLQENILKENNNVGNYYISNEYFQNKMFRYEVLENDFIVTCDGTLGEIFQLKNIKKIKGIISSSLLRIRLNPNIVDYAYFYYYFQAILKWKLIKKSNNSVLKHLPGINEIKETEIILPNMSEQKKIGLILKNIDIQIKKNNNMVQKFKVLGKSIYCKNIKYSDFVKLENISKIITGKEDANHSTENGKYKFFTCSDEILSCDDFKFEGKSILVAGNGNFNVKYYDGKFNAYQRTYVIKNDEIIGNLYYTLLFNTELFTKKANGSIIKFITINMLNNIDVPKFNDETNDVLNRILEQINSINSETDNLLELKSKLLPLLINQQLI